MNRSVAEPLWVGVDLGTQSSKVAIVSGSGLVVARTTRNLTSLRRGGVHEQDPAVWVSAVRDAVAEAVGSLTSAQRNSIRGVAMCSTSGTLAVVDAEGTPISPGVMYDDSRGAPFLDLVLTSGASLWAAQGTHPQSSWAICKLAWFAAEGTLSAGSRVVHQGDLVAEAMAGHPVATDWSSALKTGVDLHRGAWPNAVLEALHVPLSALPAVVAPGTRIATTSAEWEVQTGLPQGTAIHAGMTDGCAAQLGAGALALGDWHSVVGTTLVVKGVSSAPVFDDAGVVYSHRAPHEDLWLPGGASNVGAGALSQLFPDADLTTLDDRVDLAVAAGSLCYPLISAGERFPFVQPNARGFVRMKGRDVGLGALSATDDASGIGALWAGIAFTERLCFDTLSGHGAPITGRISTSGGGTRSRRWTTLRASVLDRPLVIPAASDGALGMAILAAWGADSSRTLADVASSMSAIAETISPDPQLTKPLADGYAHFAASLRDHGWMDA